MKLKKKKHFFVFFLRLWSEQSVLLVQEPAIFVNILKKAKSMNAEYTKNALKKINFKNRSKLRDTMPFELSSTVEESLALNR